MASRNSTLWLALGFGFGFGCSDVASSPESPPSDDWQGIEEVSEGLVDLSGRCTFGSNTLTCTMQANDIMEISRKDPNIVVNGFSVVTAGTTATATNTKRLVVNGSPGTDDLILDFANGTFAMGATTQPSGIAVDLVSGSNDALKIHGSPGTDKYVYGSAGVSINGDGIVDITYANVDLHTISLSHGDDTFSGAGNTATGGATTNPLTVFGSDGNDTIRGGAASDALNGGDGNDTFTTGSVPDGSDTMIGGAGTDVADYSLRTGTLTLTLSATTAGNDGENGEGDNIGGTATSAAGDVEQVRGGGGNDTITGSNNADTLSGGGGNDTLDGLLGNDVLNGEAGNDTFLESGTVPSGADVFNGGPGVDTVSYASRTAAVTIRMDNALADDGESGEGDKIASDVENATTGSGNDSITGSSAANTLDGGSGNDTISGGAGDDSIVGGLGTDTLDGGSGNDTFKEGSANSGADTITGGAGRDLADYADRTVGVTVTLDDLNNDGQTGAGEGDNVRSDVEDITGSSTAANALTGSAGDNTLRGGALADTLNGGLGNDTLLGGAGNDALDGGLGSDWLEGEAGNDTLTCGGGDPDLGFFDSDDIDPDGDGLCELSSTEVLPVPPMRVATGTFTGNGADDRAITGVGFQPDVVILRNASSGSASAVFRTSTMVGDVSKRVVDTAGLTANLIQSLDADGFTLGSASDVNNNTHTFFWVALKAGNDLKVGSYVGNGADNRNITGVGFQPIWLVTIGDGSDAVFRPDSVGGDGAFTLAGNGQGGSVANIIQSFSADGFQLGSSTLSNQNTTTYHYIAWGASARVVQTTYTGNDTDNRSIAVGIQPDLVWIKENSFTAACWRSSATVGDQFHQFSDSGSSTSDGIQAFEANGFQIGRHPSVNGNGNSHHFLAIKN